MELPSREPQRALDAEQQEARPEEGGRDDGEHPPGESETWIARYGRLRRQVSRTAVHPRAATVFA